MKAERNASYKNKLSFFVKFIYNYLSKLRDACLVKLYWLTDWLTCWFIQTTPLHNWFARIIYSKRCWWWWSRSEAWALSVLVLSFHFNNIYVVCVCEFSYLILLIQKFEMDEWMRNKKKKSEHSTGWMPPSSFFLFLLLLLSHTLTKS